MKIAIVTRQMITGGVERALIGMLNIMNCNDEVDLYVEQLGGELFEELPDWVNVIEIPKKKWDLSKTSLFCRMKALIAQFELHLCKEYIKQCELSARSFPIINKEYDMAVAYHAPNTIPVFYVIHNLKARKKVLWLHGDIETNHMTGKLAKHYYQQYDKIFAVSKQSKKIFGKYFPELIQRCDVFYNILTQKYLLQQAKEPLDIQIEGTFILTVGRLSREKGQFMIPQIASLLLNKGFMFSWYLIGAGEQEETVKAEIKKYNVSDNVVMLGNKTNPYSYMEKCDIYVQTSLTEGWGLTVQEAKSLRRPIVATPIPAFLEQIKDYENGLIADEISPRAIGEKISMLLENPDLKVQLIKKLQKEKDNNEDIKKLYI